MSFGERLRERREQLNMSRRELADALGVSVSAIMKQESARRRKRCSCVYLTACKQTPTRCTATISEAGKTL